MSWLEELAIKIAKIEAEVRELIYGNLPITGEQLPLDFMNSIELD